MQAEGFGFLAKRVRLSLDLFHNLGIVFSEPTELQWFSKDKIFSRVSRIPQLSDSII